jgi:hypothetical protein
MRCVACAAASGHTPRCVVSAGLRRPTPTEALLAAAGGRSRLLKTTSNTDTVVEEDCNGDTGPPPAKYPACKKRISPTQIIGVQRFCSGNTSARENTQVLAQAVLLGAGGAPIGGSDGCRGSAPRVSQDHRSLSANRRGSTRRPTGGPPGNRRMNGALPGECLGKAEPEPRIKSYSMVLSRVDHPS